MEFLKNKDLVHQKIVSITEEDDWSFSVEYKDKTVLVYASPSLGNVDGILKNLLERLDKRQPLIVTLNTSENLKVITGNFKKLADFHKFLQLIVVNPDSLTETKWVIYPYTHSRIADPESLELGLKAMYDTVDSVSVEKAKEFL